MGRGGGASRKRGGGGAAAAVAPESGPPTAAGVAGMDALTRDEKAAVDDYSTIHYSDINNVLRGRFANPRFQEQIDAAKGRIKALDAAIAKGSLARDAVLFRGTHIDAVGGKVPAVGTVFSDGGFLSTSPSRDSAASFASGSAGMGALLRIAAPKGTRAIDVSHVAGGHEKEVLLNRGTKLKVTGVSQSGGHTVIDVKVVR